MAKTAKSNRKLPAIDSKVGKYFVETKVKGKPKGESALKAGYADDAHTSLIEQSTGFQALERHFKDELLSKISMSDIADALADNILQLDKDGQKPKMVDRGSRNAAITIALGKIEPDKVPEREAPIMVILK